MTARCVLERTTESDDEEKRDTNYNEDMVLNDESVQVLDRTIQRCIRLLRVLVACFYNKTQQKNDGSFIDILPTRYPML